MREFVEHLVERPDGPGLLVVITVRGEAALAPFAFPRVDIELTGLPPEAARELVGLVGASAPLPAGLVRRLLARGDGVPLFLEEATRMALELGRRRRLGADVRSRDRAGVAAGSADGPPGRPRRAKHVAQVAAVVGREFSRDLLTALLETGRPRWISARRALAVLVDSGLVRSGVKGSTRSSTR